MNSIQKFLLYFLIFIIGGSNLSIYAKESENKNEIETLSKNIAKSSAIFLVNFALDELQNKIKLDMEHKDIKAIVIKDLFLDENILVSYKGKDNKVYFSKELPNNYKNYKNIKNNIIEKKSYTSTILGELTLYYEDNISSDTLSNLSQEEKQYLKDKKVIKMCIDPNWMPFEMIKDGEHIGITSEYIKIFSKKIDTKIKLVKTNRWIESLEKIKHRECDILSLASKTPEREKYVDFTTPYITTPIVIATKIGIPFVDDITLILDKKIGVVKGYSLFEILRKKYPNINLVEVNSIKDGLNQVEKGKLFGYLDNTIVINHEIQQNYIGTITVSGKLNTNINLCVATRDDEKILNEIFDKVILSIGQNTKQDILTKWVKVNYSIKTDYTLLLILSFISLLIIFIIVYWNRKLSKLNKELAIQRDKAHEATKAKSEFLANMSHEIRTPMSGIMGMSALALKCNLDNKSRNYIQKIDYSATSLLSILNDILDFSKIEAGKLKIEKINFNLEDLVDSVINLIEFKANEKNIKIIVNYGEDVKKELFGDSLRISQILTNLIGNAVKFTSHGEIGIYIANNDNIVRFEVKDTGIGIDLKRQKDLFDPFIQSDGSTTRKYGGTGLGLSISKQLIKLMGGKIWVKSKKNIGSSFIFELKLVSSNCSSQNISNIMKTSLNDINTIKGLNILVVEDNKINQEIIVGLLENSGIIIDIANNGKEAVEKFNKNSYQLILMDIQMPVMDGYEATRIIRKENKDIPIIALSANVMQDDLKRSKDAGMDDHLNKPIDIEKLNSTILKYSTFKNFNNSVVNSKEKNEIIIPEFINIDVKSGLFYLSGDKKLYLKILNNFKESYSNLELKSLNDDEFKRAIHTMKGLSANIGAIALHNIIKKIDKEDDKTLLVTFYDELNKVLKELKILDSDDLTKDGILTEISIVKRDYLFVQLKEAIISKRPKNYNPIVEEIEKYKLSKDYEELFQQIKEFLRKYKFKEAIELFDQIK